MQNPLGEEAQDVQIPEETLIFFKDTLESAETARRMKNYHHCFEHYNVPGFLRTSSPVVPRTGNPGGRHFSQKIFS